MREEERPTAPRPLPPSERDVESPFALREDLHERDVKHDAARESERNREEAETRPPGEERHRAADAGRKAREQRPAGTLERCGRLRSAPRGLLRRRRAALRVGDRDRDSPAEVALRVAERPVVGVALARIFSTSGATDSRGPVARETRLADDDRAQVAENAPAVRRRLLGDLLRQASRPVRRLERFELLALVRVRGVDGLRVLRVTRRTVMPDTESAAAIAGATSEQTLTAPTGPLAASSVKSRFASALVRASAAARARSIGRVVSFGSPGTADHSSTSRRRASAGVAEDVTEVVERRRRHMTRIAVDNYRFFLH